MEHQAPVLFDDSRYKVVAAGRRWGKTTMCLKCVLQGHGPKLADGSQRWPGALSTGDRRGGRIWWVAPVYSQASGVWSALKRATAPRSNRERSISETEIYKSEVERTLWLPGGGSVSVKTADDPDNLRGYGLDGVVLDEAAFMKEETWSEVLRPALIDRGGWAIFISTPNGLNWFHKLFDDAPRRPGWARWQQPTWANPRIPESEIENLRSDPTFSSLTFQQEVEAKFVEAGAGMFREEFFRHHVFEGEHYRLMHAEDFALVDKQDLSKFTTVDLAVSEKTTAHFTVLSTWGVTPDRQLLLLDCDRARYEGPDIIPRIRRQYDMWHPAYIGIERVGFQLSLIQQASREGLPVRELHPAKDKVTRALTAVAFMEQGRVWFPKDAPWLRDIETEVLQFPVGEYDDFVDTLSYACAEVAGGRFDPPVVPISIGQANPWRI
jgi:predicted phage terminase large subunit-like protein